MLTVDPVAARGRGKNSKGKSAAMEEENPCECAGPITLQTLFEVPDALGTTLVPITTLEQAIAATPPNCVLTVPTPDMLSFVPPAPANAALVPIIKATADVIQPCTTGPTGTCAAGWTYLDGTPVDPAMFEADEPDQGDSIVVIGDEVTGLFQGVPPGGQNNAATELRAYYSCCLVMEETCLAFEEPATAVPTPSPTKGKSRGRVR